MIGVRGTPQTGRHQAWLLATVGVVLAAFAPVAAAAPAVDLVAIRASKRVTAAKIAEPIVVDGVLDEPAWQQASITTDFYQQQPAEFELATRRTEVRFLYDDQTLYVGAILYDDQPGRLITNELKRDFTGSSGDGFGVVIDPYQDRRNSYGFITNPGGAQRETLAYENGRRNDANWNGVWFVRTRVRADGWSVELAIPFKTLRFPAHDIQEWGLNMVRWARRANETSTWAPVPRQFSHYNVAYAGTLDGIAAVERGRSLQVKPFLTGQVAETPSGDAWRRDMDGGVDLKWGLTSSLLLDATWRTDFSQVEADEQQINLTRFSLFQPEKREFFLESPAAFQIGLVESDMDEPRRDLVPFFSRRIGLSADGRPIPVIGGVRLTGRAGNTGIGALTMQTEAFEGRPGDNFTALRVSRDLTGTASMAGFYFGREASDGSTFNRVGGFDLRLRPRRTLEIEAFGMRSETAAQDGDFAGRLGLRLDGTRHRARAGFLHVGDDFRHDLGFVRRRGVGLLFGRYTRAFRPADTRSRVREYTVGADFESTTDDAYRDVLTRIGGLRYGMAFSDGGTLAARVGTTFEHLDAPFGIGGQLSVPAGEYDYADASVEYSSNVSAPVSGRVALGAGEFWTGRQREVAGSLRWRVNANFAASTTFSRNAIRLPDGRFVGELVGLRFDWSFTPRMFLNAFVQHNSETDTWLSNVRFNLIHRPLSDIYVVWNETRVPGLTRRALLFKYTQMFQF